MLSEYPLGPTGFRWITAGKAKREYVVGRKVSDGSAEENGLSGIPGKMFAMDGKMMDLSRGGMIILVGDCRGAISWKKGESW